MTLEPFKASFHGDIVLPGDPDYSQSITRWALNAIRQARIVAFVKDVHDIGLAIEYAKKQKLSLAVRCGGHNVIGASSVEDGLVVDLSRYMNKVKIDEEKRLAYVQGGSLWRDVDRAAIEYGLATVGGTVNHTGVGGYTLGGGVGWLQGAHGLSVDNLVKAELVLASGLTATASETENPDLFWAIRGGGGNFGIVTEFVYRLHLQRRTVYTGNLTFPASKAGEVLEALKNWWGDGSRHENDATYLLCHRDGSMDESALTVILFYNGSEAAGRENFRNIFNLGPLQDLTCEIPYEELNGFYNAFYESGLVRHERGFYFNPLHIEAGIFHDILTNLNSLPCQKWGLSFTVAFEFQVFKAAPEDAMALPRKLMNNGFALMGWKEYTAESMSFARKAMWDVLEMISPGHVFFSGKETATQFAEEHDHRISSTKNRKGLYGEEKWRKLCQLKRKYDPDLLFNKWFPIEVETNEEDTSVA